MNRNNIKKIPKSIFFKIHSEKQNICLSRANYLSPILVQDILNQMQEDFGFESNWYAIAVLTVFFQYGGTSRSCSGNLTIKMFDRVIKFSSIRHILKMKRCIKGERKLARSLATPIFEIANILEIPGNLYYKIQRKYPHQKFTMQEKVWLSDFQSLNLHCEDRLRILIQDSLRLNNY